MISIEEFNRVKTFVENILNGSGQYISSFKTTENVIKFYVTSKDQKDRLYAIYYFLDKTIDMKFKID